MDSKFPTLDLLERHGLRSAYVLLLLGAGSWRHFQNLHDKNIPETCRLPRNLLLVLKGEYKRMVGGNARRYDDTDKDVLLDEFNRARGKSDLQRLYLERLNASLAENRERRVTGFAGDENAWFGESVSGVHYSRRTFHGRWRETDVRLSLVINQGTSLLLEIVISGSAVTLARTDELAESAHPSFIQATVDEWRDLRLRHKFALERGSMLPHHRGSEHITISDDGVEHLRGLVAKIGVTDLEAR